MKKLFTILVLFGAIISGQDRIEAVSKEDIARIPLILKQTLIDSLSSDGEELQILEEIIYKAHDKVNALNLDAQALDNKLSIILKKKGILTEISFFLSWVIHEVNIKDIKALISQKKFKKMKFEKALFKILKLKLEQLNLMREEYRALNQILIP